MQLRLLPVLSKPVSTIFCNFVNRFVSKNFFFVLLPFYPFVVMYLCPDVLFSCCPVDPLSHRPAVQLSCCPHVLLSCLSVSLYVRFNWIMDYSKSRYLVNCNPKTMQQKDRQMELRKDKTNSRDASASAKIPIQMHINPSKILMNTCNMFGEMRRM